MDLEPLELSAPRMTGSAVRLPSKSTGRPSQELQCNAGLGGQLPSPPRARRSLPPAPAVVRGIAGNCFGPSTAPARSSGSGPSLVPRSYCHLSVGNVRARPMRLRPQSVWAGISRVSRSVPAAKEAAFAVILPIAYSQFSTFGAVTAGGSSGRISSTFQLLCSSPCRLKWISLTPSCLA